MNDLSSVARRGTTLRRVSDLVDNGLVDARRSAELEAVAGRYAVAITPQMVDLIGDAADPVARQFVPDAAELVTLPEERADPIGDDVHEAVPGLIHRYPDRVLLKLVSACAVYCRFCFRRETVGQGEALSPDELARALDYVRANAAIWEVIVSGGDPLVASARRIGSLVRALAEIAHVRVVRFHTRVPVVAPDRITPELVAALKVDGITPWVAIHANHASEFTPAARAAVARLVDAGIPLVSQTVLLRGINDTPDALEALMRTLVENRIKPYYLHHADLAPGTANFRTTLAEGQAVVRALRGAVSGLCQPTYVLDIPGGHGKVPVGPAYAGGGWVIDPAGNRHAYPPSPQGIVNRGKDET